MNQSKKAFRKNAMYISPKTNLAFKARAVELFNVISEKWGSDMSIEDIRILLMLTDDHVKHQTNALPLSAIVASH